MVNYLNRLMAKWPKGEQQKILQAMVKAGTAKERDGRIEITRYSFLQKVSYLLGPKVGDSRLSPEESQEVKKLSWRQSSSLEARKQSITGAYTCMHYDDDRRNRLYPYETTRRWADNGYLDTIPKALG